MRQKPITGYKGFTYKTKEQLQLSGKKGEEGLYCKNMRYEVGKQHRITGKLKLCANGLHFCLNPEKVLGFYSISMQTFFCRVITGQNYLTDIFASKYAASRLTLTELIPNEEYLSLIKWRKSGGKKRLKNIRYSNSYLIFNTPELYVKFAKLRATTSMKKIPAEVQYYQGESCLLVTKLL